MEIGRYEKDWSSFKVYIEEKARERCILTNKNWLRLREFHLDKYLKRHRSPFGFLFRMKYFHPEKYRRIHCMPFFYGKYKQLHFQKFNKGFDEIEQ